MADAKIGSIAGRTDVYRIRIGLQGALHVSQVIQPYVEANLRQDGGSAESGQGIEIGGGARVAFPQWKLRGQLHSQTLIMHTADGFAEWGISGWVQFGNASRGFTITVRPSWGLSYGMTLHR